ncbi:MAG TPA: hypothetical protein VG777_02820, partial [Thermoanaerobaculia bacterium]|nr:hypothetical protein [Thermoanaerobaculia bacterium]
MTRSARIAAVALLAAGCRTALAPAGLPAYLIDPRTGLSGPFPAAVASGWGEMALRHFPEALRAFESAKGPAAAIGRVQALLELGRVSEAREGCAAAFAQGVETAPVLAACGETAARAGQWPEAYDLFEAALLRVPGSSGLLERKKATAGKAVRSLVEKARGELASQAAEARADAERALAIAPDELDALVVAGRAADASGDRAAGFELLYAAWKREPTDVSVGEEAGNLARATGRGDVAYEIFSALARSDSKFRARAEESEEDFVISNWPAPERAI